MQLSLRPYVTTGVAIVGASVIAAAPLQPVVPAEIQIPNPAVQAVERGVQLTANEIQTAVNNCNIRLRRTPTVAGAELLGNSSNLVIGEDLAAIYPLAALGFAGPLISGGGSVGTALQDIVDSDGFRRLLLNLIGALGTITRRLGQRRLRARSGLPRGRSVARTAIRYPRRRSRQTSFAARGHRPRRGAYQPRRHGRRIPTPCRLSARCMRKFHHSQALSLRSRLVMSSYSACLAADKTPASLWWPSRPANRGWGESLTCNLVGSGSLHC